MTANIFVYQVKTPNLGDRNSCPKDYFAFPGRKMDIAKLDEKVLLGARNIIVGGGGAFHCTLAMNLLRQLPAKKIAWGIGTNDHGSCNTAVDWTGFDLIGCRDKGDNWVPCASCMATLFDNVPPATEDIVVYQHHKRPLNLPLPTKANNLATLCEAIGFLASGRTVITNSYHGAYWATLLGRRVALFKLWSSKFYAFPWPVPAINSMEEASRATSFPGALAEARQANLKFKCRVDTYLEHDS